MLVKLTSEILAAIGCANAAEFPDKLSAYVAEATKAKTFMADSKVTLETLQASITALEGKVLTEARVKEIVGADIGAKVTDAMTAFLGSDAGKKIIGAEASRITMEANAAIGTAPVKPAPAPTGSTVEQANALVEQGKYEEAWAINENLQAEFPTAKVFAHYAKAAAEGRVTVAKTKN